MNLQVCCPYKPCPYKCPICIAQYEVYPFEDIYFSDKKTWQKNLKKIIKDKNIKAIIITGDTEPTLFIEFINDVIQIANKMRIPVELQTKNYTINPNQTFFGLDVISYSNIGHDMIQKHNILNHKITREVFILTKDLYDNFDQLVNYIKHNKKDIKNYQATIKYLQNNSHGELNNSLIKNKKVELSQLEIELLENLNVRIDKNCQDSYSRYYIYRSNGKLYSAWNEF